MRLNNAIPVPLAYTYSSAGCPQPRIKLGPKAYWKTSIRNFICFYARPGTAHATILRILFRSRDRVWKKTENIINLRKLNTDDAVYDIDAFRVAEYFFGQCVSAVNYRSVGTG